MFNCILGPAPTERDVSSATLYLEYYGGHINELVRAKRPGKHYVSEYSVLPQIKAFMASEGWEFSGSGYFSAVFVKGGLAIKLGLRKEDSGATYAAWCRANQGKAGVPVIHAIDKFTDCYVVLMDRCYKWDRGADDATDVEAELVKDLIQYGAGDPIAHFPSTGTAQEIRAFFDGIAFFDCNRGNLMLDRYGALTITDPVSFDRADRRRKRPAKPKVKAYSYSYYSYSY